MKKIFYISFLTIILFSFSSCLNDLNTKPEVELSLEELLQQDPNAISGIVSRLYASFALSSVTGPDNSDIDDNAGESPFLRGIVNLQDFTADGMKNRWGDDGLDQLTTTSNWDENNKFFRYLYNRIYYTIPQANNLLAILKIVSVEDQDNITSEVRFLRALAYYYLIDAFGKGVLATEDNLGSSEPLPEATRIELFNFVETELLAIENKIADTNGYGRANKAVVRMLLAKLYLNAKVYTGIERFEEAGAYTKKVIDEGGYTLATNYVSIFSGDNETSTEIIFPLIADAITSQSYGNTTYIINGSLSVDTMTPEDFHSKQGWTGHRATKAWYGLYEGGISSGDELRNAVDERAQLFWIGKDEDDNDIHNFEMTDYKEWTDGYPSIKFRNTNFNGTSVATDFSSTDFPLFRLADAYLMYAECALRGSSATDLATALGYVNSIRTRSNATTISQNELTLDFILDERARELNLEGHRRSDLIRFEKFTGASYLWPWKGNTVNGTAIPETYKLFPIPLTALGANPNLKQNPGY
ncbi:RagB/SusD family nutrient uptake outer membrane protein [Tenacibaculum sp. IB213877]|uniref:RagB/SusD family nutrient uptake outer membrane protein n=1 Tax=Tenacibaculum sp. IB213877 TaxID=3097351 RepID=UPI002A5A6AFB|nr:RagB/SusD family nutrient uptake outer membrane protein [Tenacibaculum sp. IB213877]MDY0779484.1 RagB/SusD family nutrient uptake outer membrane protein [Tenacibaculum sp. IB213877]